MSAISVKIQTMTKQITNQMFHINKLTAAVSILIFSASTYAEQCSTDYLAPYTQLGGDASDNKIYVEADDSESDFNLANFQGNVQVRQGNKYIHGPQINYEKGKAEFYGEKEIMFSSPETVVKGDGVNYNTDTDVITAEKADYYLAGRTDKKGDRGAQGSGKNIRFDQKTKIDTMQDVTWTTCQRENPTWHINAKELKINRNTNRAVAKNATFQIKDMPVFYMPYVSFPTNGERASGFLMPSMASTEKRGVEIRIPYYWNIAPNQDATFTARPMTKRGLMLETEYRLLTTNQRLNFNGDILPDDKKRDGNNRWNIATDYQYQLNSDWKAEVLFQNVSDRDYLDDMEGDFRLYDEWYLDRYARISGKGDWGRLQAQVQDYKIASSNILDRDKPYSLLPQVEYFKSLDLPAEFRLDTRAEAVRFHKHHYGDAARFTAEADISRRFETSYSFIEPKITGNIRHYDFSPDNNAFRDGKRTIFTPIFSVDSGLIFEREFHFGDAFTQTFEPRLFYLYTPNRDQSDIPDFDTAERSKSWSWLFARNRFVGGDKIGDANQLTTAVTTRFNRQSDGSEKARLSVGQIQYFADRKTALYGEKGREENKSVMVGEGKYALDQHWSIYGLSLWDTDKHNNERNVVEVRYDLDEDRYLRFGHHYTEDEYNQLTLAGGWRLNSNWRMFAREDYSLHTEKNTNALLGLEYEDCCWAWRLAGRRWRDNHDDIKAHNGVYLEFVFKGLGNVGSRTGGMLQEQLDGYRPLTQEK